MGLLNKTKIQIGRGYNMVVYYELYVGGELQNTYKNIDDAKTNASMYYYNVYNQHVTVSINKITVENVDFKYK